MTNKSLDKFENIICEGRFQPIHKGHVEYIKKLLKIGRRVWVIVLANETSKNVSKNNSLPVEGFSQYIDRHHTLEKNPFPLWERYLTVHETLKQELGLEKPVFVLMGHRWDLDWKFYRDNLPHNRVFAIPLRDSDDDRKEEALAKLGEKCIRINVSDLPQISATLVREKFKKGEKFCDMVSAKTFSLLDVSRFKN